ncbi:hypothetical protein ACFOY4_10165 [Actinomadura syzygii]|uniref:hypothetical protein n=1 Tax=Actinomadura syzygii TaxID=1427538 RepID=UPI001CA3270F|nr:hypothetical protein [Actinomadura syzygii]
MIEDRVSRSYARTAKITFYVVAIVVGLLAATITTSYLPPIAAVLLGGLIGAAVGLLVAAFIVCWPVLRVLWWWAPEIGLTLLAGYGWVLLATHLPLFGRIIILTVLAGVPAVIPALRSRVKAIAWCVITRHRLRVCFNEFIITNRSGTLPLILWARPTRTGERVWAWLRPGLSLADLQSRLDKIAVTCWAASVTVEAASDSNAAVVRIDVKRRAVLTGTIETPLLDLVDNTDTPTTQRAAHPVPTALDLPDVPATSDDNQRGPSRTADPDAVPAPDAARAKPTKTSKSAKAGATGPTAVPQPVNSGEDISDWI